MQMKYDIGAIISVKIRDDLFTLAQARENHLFEFFDVKRNCDSQWIGVDLNVSKSLFCLYVASNKMRAVFAKLKKCNSVSISTLPTGRIMLSSFPVADGKYISEVSLVELPDSFDSVDKKIIKENLLPQSDQDLLCKYELIGMVNSSYIINRLCKYYDNGLNWDTQKEFIFKGDLKPMKGINF
jgi:hypothetical protein